jgi:hypothetical protein
MPDEPAIAGALPELLTLTDGSTVRNAAQWFAHAQDIGAPWLRLVYGPLPAEPETTHASLLHSFDMAQFGGARLSHWRITTGPAPRRVFTMQLLAPAGAARRPVILSGDACWRYATDAVVSELLHRGYALAQFNRVEIYADTAGPDGPDKMPGVSAVAAWAWGYRRCVDALLGMDSIDPLAIAVTGHSRGGKAALLAGALDTRIALTHANNSGTGGSGSFHAMGEGSETLAQLVGAFAHWMGPELAAFAGREAALPFDQHLVKAMVAPRALLTTDARGDPWANPSGCWLTFEAARAVYRLLDAQERCAIVMREGGHPMHLDDWRALLDFADLQLPGTPARAG